MASSLRAWAVVGALAAMVSCGSSSGSVPDGGAGAGGGTGNGGAGGSTYTGTISCTHNQTVMSGGDTLMMRLCAEQSGLSALQIDAYRMGCGPATAGGPDAGFTQERIFTEGPCSHDGALGGCQQMILGITQTAWYYADDSGITLDMVQMVCSMAGGTFIAP